MPTVELNGQTVEIQRFTLAKATRVMTLLQKLQQEVPEVTKAWAEFRRDYAEEYPTRIRRLEAIYRFGVEVSDEEWERAGQVFEVPGVPNQAEVFFQMAPLVYERAEEIGLRLLGLIAMPNDVVRRYVKDGVIWDRVDEFVEERIMDAPLDEIMELVVAAAETIDRQVLEKARNLGDRAGNVARLLGWKKTDSETSSTSSDEPVQPSTISVGPSPDNSDGTPTESSTSHGTSSTTSTTPAPETVMSN